MREYCVTNCIDICYPNGNLNVATVPVVKYHPFCPAGTDATDWHRDAMANTHLEGRMEVGSKEWHWFILSVQRLSCLLAISQVLSNIYCMWAPWLAGTCRLQSVIDRHLILSQGHTNADGHCKFSNKSPLRLSQNWGPHFEWHVVENYGNTRILQVLSACFFF